MPLSSVPNDVCNIVTNLFADYLRHSQNLIVNSAKMKLLIALNVLIANQLYTGGCQKEPITNFTKVIAKKNGEDICKCGIAAGHSIVQQGLRMPKRPSAVASLTCGFGSLGGHWTAIFGGWLFLEFDPFQAPLRAQLNNVGSSNQLCF